MNTALWLSMLANHLWQSTVCVGIVAILTLVLKDNRAQIRYWLWVVSSAKFLFPFVFLTIIGNYVPRTPNRPAAKPLTAIVAFEAVSQPFSVATSSETKRINAPNQRLWPTLPLLLTATWVLGGCWVAIFYYRRWRSVAIVAREAKPLSGGREADILSRLYRLHGLAKPILIPEDLGHYLDEQQLEAILAHELSHARRHDNFWAALQMIVEVLFWFHPLVWFIGSRLVEERESASDQDVLRHGCEPEVYTTAMVRICELCLASPVKCVSGVTGSDLRKRVESVMINRPELCLNFMKKALLVAAGLGLLSTAFVFAAVRSQGNASPQRFEVVSLKSEPPKPPADLTNVIGLACRGIDGLRRSQGGTTGPRAVSAPQGRCVAEHLSLVEILGFAYEASTQNTSPMRILGGPDWIRPGVSRQTGSLYHIEAKAEDPEKATTQQLREMLQTMLAERFKLQFHFETKDVDGLALLVDTGGPKLKEAKPTGGDDNPDLKPVTVQSRADLPPWEPGWNVFQGITSMRVITQTLGVFIQSAPAKPVMDRTGLTGTYEVSMAFPRGIGSQATEDLIAQNLDLRLSSGQKYLRQFGLRAITAKVPVESLVIDHAEKPTEN